jgi:ABC-2 type transport system ATP-binding protein
MLSIEHLSIEFSSKPILEDISFLVNKKDRIALVGKNGAGKTTLLRLILDLIKATDGNVLSADKDVSQSDDWKLYTGSFIDGHFLIDFYTPEEYFTFIARLYGISDETLHERLETFRPLMHDEILGTKKYLRDFSESNRQKIGIIGAMMIRPKVLLLDEPFNYLDPSSQIVVARMIADMNRELGTTVLISGAKFPEIIKFLADKMPNVNGVDKDGNSVLHLCAATADDETVRKLLYYSVKEDLPNKAGETPLLCAARAGNVDMVKRLLSMNVKVTQKIVDAAANDEIKALLSAKLKK